MRGDSTARLDPTYAAIAIEDATDREQILGLLVRAVRSATGFAALLLVQPTELRGHRSADESGSDIDALRIARGSVPAFEAAITTKTANVGPIATGEPFVDGVIEQLGGATRSALVLPIIADDQVVALVVGHRGQERLDSDDVAALFPLAEVARVALGRVREVRVRGATSTKLIREAGYEIEVTLNDPASKRTTIAALRAKQSWEALADALRDLARDGIERGDPDEAEQLELFVELAGIETDRLKRVDRAIEAWRSALTIDATDMRALDGLQQLFVRHERWRDCADLLDKRVALAEDPEQRIALLLEVAKIARSKLDDDDAAIAAYERIRNWDPVNAVATRELETIYTAREQWEPLATLLLDRAARPLQAEQRAAELDAVARLYEDKVGDLRSAFLVRVAMVRGEPERAALIDELARLAPLAHAWDDVLAEGAALAEELEERTPRAAARLWHLVARWLRERGNQADAGAALDHAYRLDPENQDLAPDMLASLRAEGRWQELANLLAQRANAEADLEQRSALYAELGEITERFASPAESIEWYERAAADEPEAVPVLAALHRLYRRTESWDKLADLVPRYVALQHERPALVSLNLELGRVLADHLDRPDDAVRAYQAVLAIEPRHPGAFAGIARVYQATGQTEALLDAREAELDVKASGDRPYAELAATWHDRGRFDRAIVCWRKLLAIDSANAVALEGLTRALRDSESWAELASTLRARLELARERTPLLVELAHVLDERLDDADGAAAAYRAALAADPDHVDALDSLARLADRSEQYTLAIDTLQHLLELTTAPKPRADVFQRLGHARLNARDAAGARLDLVQAIALDVDNAGALEGMGRLHLMQGELVAAGEELVRAARASTTDADRVRRFADAAWVFRHRLHDAERARQCLHLILDLEPEHADAKQALAELLADTKQWESLWPHLEQEVERVRDAGTPAEKVDVFARAARCALELDKFDIALDLFEHACELDNGPGLQLERADALFRSGAVDAAAASYQTIVLVHGQKLPREQMVAVYRRLAEIHASLGRAAQAQLFHGKVLELDPTHRATLWDLAELQIGRGRYDEAIAHLRTLVASVPAEQRIPYLERIGELYAVKLLNPPKAMSTYVEALELDSANRRVLQRLLELQTESGQWRAAVETIGRFLEHETDPVRRGAYFIAEAEIRRGELRDKAGALDAYERALDMLAAEPSGRARAIEAFRIVDEMLTAEKDWKKQEQAYRRMIKRVPQGDPMLVALWHALGEVYRSRLELPDHAIEAFEVAHSLDPGKSPARAGILAELYSRGSKPQQVTEKAAKLVEADPDQSIVYRALGRAGMDAGRIDEAWCVARALVFMKKANADETALYKRYQTQEVAKATGILDEEAWANVRHPDEDPVLSAIFALAWQAPVALRAGPSKSFDLKPKDRMPVEDGTRVIAKIFRHAARVLNVALPDVYIDPKRSGRLLLANVIERGRLLPTIIVGRDLMTGYRDTELASAVGVMLAQLRPAYYLKVALPSLDELEAALAAAVHVVGGTRPVRAEVEPLRATFAAEMKKRLTRAAGEALHPLVAGLPEHSDLARWRNAVDTAAQRAGLLVSGELAAAARMLSTEATPPGGPRPLQRVHDLVSYSVSPSYFAVRAHLGVTVGR